MGYLKGLSDINFKTDEDGKTLFYPWGVLGRGYVLPDESKTQQIRRFKKNYHMISIPCMSTIALAILGGWVNCFVLILIFPIWYFLGTALLLKGLPRATHTKLNFKESYANSSMSHNIIVLWLMLLLCVLFILSGILVLVLDKTAWFIGLTCILFFGLCGCAIGYMIKIKHRKNLGPRVALATSCQCSKNKRNCNHH